MKVVYSIYTTSGQLETNIYIYTYIYIYLKQMGKWTF